MLVIERSARGLTQAEVAAYADVSPEYVCELELGKHRNPKLLTIQAVATACGMGLITLLKKVEIYEQTSRSMAK